MNARSVLNKASSLLLGIMIIAFVGYLINWGVFKASFDVTNARECTSNGACWGIVVNRFNQFMFGFYPEAQQYRIYIGVLLIVCAFILLLIQHFKIIYRFISALLLLMASVVILYGGVFGLSIVPTDKWGGLFLTLFLSFSSIFCASPVALLLALGRHSELPFVRALCITFIELVRGVPLISVLFMASVMLPFFLPHDVDIDKLLRAFIGLTLFQAAYLAEVIRGGLNAIPKGQIEAGYSLGMHYWQVMGKIVLPQAVVLMIPGIVNSYIALFKDTTLVLIIGLYDLLGIAQAAVTDPKWLGLNLEVYLFCAFVYWLFCFSMSMYSKHLEQKLKLKL